MSTLDDRPQFTRILVGANHVRAIHELPLQRCAMTRRRSLQKSGEGAGYRVLDEVFANAILKAALFRMATLGGKTAH